MAQIITVAPPTGDARADTAAIQTAIQQAHAAYKENPADGQVKVQLSAGTYIVTGDPSNPSVGAVELLSGVALVGAGIGATTLKLMDNFNARINGIVRTALEAVEQVTIANLTIDGNRANNTEHQAGFISGVKDDGSGRIQSDVALLGVEIMNCTAYGFNPHEVTYDLMIENCIAHSNGLDGFVADGVVRGVYRNNASYDNDRHGFNIQNATTDLLLENNAAYHNGLGTTGGAGITIQRGDIMREDDRDGIIDWVTNIRIVGGHYHGNTREGILVKLSDNVIIDDASVYGNMRQGVRIEGSTDTILKNSAIHHNSQEELFAYDEIQIRLRNDFPDGNPDDNPATVPASNYYSTGTQILNNMIDPVNARYAIREEPTNGGGGATQTVILDNAIGGVPTKGNDIIRGSSAGEEMRGLAGNDTYIVNHTGDLVVELAGEGTDRVLAAINYTLASNVENLTLISDAAINGYGNGLSNVLIGNAAGNVLKSYGGNDILDGGGGADSMTGGSGDDTYFVDSINDAINESATESDGLPGGYDRVFSSVSYVLSTQVEELTLVGVSHIDAQGNNQANRLVGNAGNNMLDGQGGADTMVGGDGNDTYYVNHTGDIVTEHTGGGGDKVVSTISYALSPNVEHLVLINPTVVGATPATSGTGNELNNLIIGNAAANKLFGQDGNDTLDGSTGADQLHGGLGDDVFHLRKGEFSNEILADFSGDGTGQGDTLQFIGFSAQATLTSTGDTWTVIDGTYREAFKITGVTALDTDDYSFLAADPAPGPDQNDSSALVDNVFYFSRNPDVFSAGIEPEVHYATFGWKEGRDPNAMFSTRGYLAANPDVDAANINPLEHYHQNGWKEGRDVSIAFDTSLYLLHNSDVTAAGIDPLEHYLTFGRLEGREIYAAVGREIQGGFDVEYYLLANPDVAAAGVDAAFHFANWGWREGRDPNAFFDTSAYLNVYTDVAAAGINPLEHYMSQGWKEGRDPSDEFDSSSYLAAYADVAVANNNPLEHYLKYGIYEGRSSFGDSIFS